MKKKTLIFLISVLTLLTVFLGGCFNLGNGNGNGFRITRRGRANLGVYARLGAT